MARFNPDAPLIGNQAVVRLILQLVTQGTKQQITFDYYWSVPATIPTPADLAAFEAKWEANHNAKVLACLSPLTSYDQISVQEVVFGMTPTLVLPFVAGTIGTAGATNLPLEMCAVLQKKTPLKGQHGRGFTRMPAVPNTFTTPATDPNVLNATATTAYLALMNQLILPVVVGGNNWTMGLATRPVPPATLTTRFIACNLMTLDPTLGTVRTRKPGRGI